MGACTAEQKALRRERGSFLQGLDLKASGLAVLANDVFTRVQEPCMSRREVGEIRTVSPEDARVFLPGVSRNDQPVDFTRQNYNFIAARKTASLSIWPRSEKRLLACIAISCVTPGRIVQCRVRSIKAYHAGSSTIAAKSLIERPFFERTSGMNAAFDNNEESGHRQLL